MTDATDRLEAIILGRMGRFAAVRLNEEGAPTRARALAIELLKALAESPSEPATAT